ncbi:hypothetical protein Gotri_004052 [Gossypium trilobum]|uniref:Uncharacterized protein n=1 Tax=Gossypium trilobum TaxID=34281 RepID=A0A7J9F3I7_9ROSI|nr:hypothetical protein [Gossypium trilobum]
MKFDPIKMELGEGLPSNVIDDDEPNIINIHPSDAWATWRMELANQIEKTIAALVGTIIGRLLLLKMLCGTHI